MAIIKCKMCGGDIELSADKTYGTCDSCGSTMTFPKVDDEHRANLFNRANHFRRQNEFDKAISAYERILNEDDTDAEAHWGVVLSRFGIEYVEDPVSHERIPTCHRVQVASILTDEDYLAALNHAPDGYSRELYEAEARRIADIQKGILAISAQEKPYDVFICYKESTDGGSRTKDSTLAQDIYYQLKQEGFNVFFARITLEDKLGQQYEPYIFAALNSAKVMLVVGTKPEYFNAVWVKNEWSRYLALMKQDRSRLLIPCYRDMDAYDLPDELSALQSQDMSKIGFMQDLIRGVKKVLGANKPQQTVQAAAAAPVSAAAPLLRRAFMFLEDGDWDKADDFCEQVLNMEPENAEAYLGKLMATLNTNKREQLKDCANPFDNEPDYAKALRFGDAKLKAELQGYIQHINDRNEQARLEGLYQSACAHMQQARTEADYKGAARAFEEISHYKDAAEKVGVCHEKAEIARKDKIFADGKSAMGQNTEDGYASAIRLFESIPGWKDADEQIPMCQRKLQELKKKAEAERLARKRSAEQARIKAEAEAKKRKQRNTILAVLAVAAVVVFLLVTKVIIPNQKYDAAMELMAAGKYEEAIAAFSEIETHKDSAEQIKGLQLAIKHAKYDAAVVLMNEGKYLEAYEAFISLNGHKDSATMATVAYQQYEAVVKAANAAIGMAEAVEPPAELTASAKGLLSDVKVTITLAEDGTIATMVVDASGETAAIAGPCTEEAFLSNFVGKKGPFEGVEVVTSATYTSNAVINAVNSLFPAEEAAEEASPANELTASAKGLLSDVKVTITLNEDGTIATMTVDASGETAAIAGPCTEEAFLSNFVGKKGPFEGVEVVTSATYTSNAVINAVNSLFSNK